MIIDAAHNIVYRLEDVLNENNKIVERYKMKLIEPHKIWGR